MTFPSLLTFCTLYHTAKQQNITYLILLPVWPLCDLSFTFHLSFYDFFLQKSAPPPSRCIHLSVFRPWEYESFPQSRSSQTSRTSAVSVSDLHSCVEQLRHKLNLSQHPDSLPPSLCFFFSSFSLFLSPSLPPASLSFSSAVVSSKGRLPPLHRPGLIFHFQITVAHSCFATLRFSLSPFLQCTERQTQQREAETQWPC